MGSFFYCIQIITLFFSVLFIPTYSELSSIPHITFSTREMHKRDYGTNKVNCDFSHDVAWNNFDGHKLSRRANNFEKYTPQDFQHHFARSGYTETEILHQ